MYFYYYSLLNLKQWMREPEWEETQTSCYITGGGCGSLQPATCKGHWVRAGGVIVIRTGCDWNVNISDWNVNMSLFIFISL